MIFPNDANDEQRPYLERARALLLESVSLADQVGKRRPNIPNFASKWSVVVNAPGGEIYVTMEREDGSSVVIEKIIADPNSPETFGSSDLAASDPNSATDDLARVQDPALEPNPQKKIKH